MAMTKRERLMRLFQGKPVDRPAIKLWSADKYQGGSLLHPDYRPVYELALETTDLFGGSGSRFDFLGQEGARRMERAIRPYDQEWEEVIVTLHTDRGDLTEVHRQSLVGKPGYVMEHFVKCGEDLEKVLALPYAPYPIDLKAYYEANALMGDDGITLFGLSEPAYHVYCLMGSEALAFMRVESPELLERAVALYSQRMLEHVRRALDAGLHKHSNGLVFGWVGPELFLPPLMSPADFDAYVLKYDKKLIDLIHNAGGYAWIHCHGRVGSFINRFIDMGCDMLNPIEPPPMGDVSLADAFQIAGGRMALEGNIQIGEVMTGSEALIRQLVDRAVDEAGERFVLGLTAGYMEVPNPPEIYIRNLMTYLKYGYERVTSRS